MAATTLPMLIIGGYLMIFVVVGGYEARGGINRDPTDFYLAGRGLGSVVLLMTMFASVISGWAYFGGPGFSYASGMGFLALAVANLASIVLMYVMGMRVWHWGKTHDFLSPPELFAARMESPMVGLVFLVFMTIYLVPYIAIQPMAGGIIFEVISDGAISHYLGVVITIVVMTLYVLVAGMRGVAWTDTLQGVLMYVFLFFALALLVGAEFGGFGSLGSVVQSNPDLFTPPGPNDYWTPAMVFSWILLISMLNASLPYVLVRFMSAESARTVKRTSLFFGVLVMVFYFAIAYVGALGHVAYPNLEQADELFVTLVLDVLPLWVAALFLGGALSAMISTADSQLLVLSQMITRDGYRAHVEPDASRERETLVGRVVIVVLAILGGLIALYQPEFIFTLGAAIFSGIAVLTPAGLAAAFWKDVTAPAVVASTVAGELVVFGYAFSLLPASWHGPFHYSALAIGLAAVVLVGVSLATEPPSEETIERFYG